MIAFALLMTVVAAESKVPCSRFHPAQFTHVLLLAERSNPVEAYKPDLVDAEGRCGLQDDNNEGRFSVSERGEILLRFDPDVVGQASTLFVTGRLLTDSSTQELAIPGYHVLGEKDTPQVAASKATLKDAVERTVAIAPLCSDGKCGDDATKATLGQLSLLSVSETSALSEFREAATAIREGKAVSAASVSSLTSKKIAALDEIDQLVSGWSDVRIQPKEVGARDGDVIEIKIKHSLHKTDFTPTWTLRFVVEKTGFYVHASPALSLVWSNHFAPDAAFKGAQGLLVPGVEFTLDWYAAKYKHWILRALGFVFSGIGFGVDYLDFDSRQAIELGVRLNVQLFRGIVSFGFGYNLGPQEPRYSDRAFYYSIGIGIDKVLDRAARVAAFFAQ